MNYVEISSKTNTSDEIGELLIKRLVDEVVKPNKIHKQKLDHVDLNSKPNSCCAIF